MYIRSCWGIFVARPVFIGPPCPTYFGRTSSPGWDSIYLFPPVPLLPRVPSLLQYRCRGVNCSILCSVNLALQSSRLHGPKPFYRFVLLQKSNKGWVVHPNPSVYQLHTWRLWKDLLVAGFNSAVPDVYFLSHRGLCCFVISALMRLLWTTYNTGLRQATWVLSGCWYSVVSIQLLKGLYN